MARRIEQVVLAGAVGELEAIVEAPEDEAPKAAWLVCHPHPLYGGTMHNKVVYRMARGLRRSGAVVLRFNFRGVGRSGGEHAGGIGEIEDALAALRWLKERYVNLPFALAGFSFGSRVILKLGCSLEGAAPLMAVGFPTRGDDTGYLEICEKAKVFIQSTNDEFGPRQELENLFTRMREPKQIRWIPAGDHFFAGALDELESAVLDAALERTERNS